MPFAGYEDFAACVAANQDKGNPEAYCGAIQAKVEKTREVLKHYPGLHDQKDHGNWAKDILGEWILDPQRLRGLVRNGSTRQDAQELARMLADAPPVMQTLYRGMGLDSVPKVGHVFQGPASYTKSQDMAATFTSGGKHPVVLVLGPGAHGLDLAETVKGDWLNQQEVIVGGSVRVTGVQRKGKRYEIRVEEAERFKFEGSKTAPPASSSLQPLPMEGRPLTDAEKLELLRGLKLKAKVSKHYAPRHPGTGTTQRVHAGGQARFYSDPVEGEWRTHQFASDRPNISKRAILDYRLQPVRGRFAHAFKTYRGDDRGYTELDPLKGGGLLGQGAYASLLDPSGVAFQTGPSQRSPQAAGVDFNLENTLYLKVGGEGRLQPGWDDIQDAVFDLAIELYEKQYGPVAPGQSWPELLRRVGVDGVVLDFDDSIFRPGVLWGSQIVAFPWAKDRPKIRRFVNRVIATPREFIEDVRKAKPKSPKLFRLVLLEDFERQLLKESILRKHGSHDQSKHGVWAEGHTQAFAAAITPAASTFLDSNPDAVARYRTPVQLASTMADVHARLMTRGGFSTDDLEDLQVYSRLTGYTPTELSTLHSQMNAMSTAMSTMGPDWLAEFGKNLDFVRDFFKHASHNQKDHGNRRRAALAWTGSPSEYPAHSSIRGLAMRISEGEFDEPLWWGDKDSDSKGLDFPTFLEHTKTLLDAVDSDKIDRPLYRGLFLHGKYHKDAISRFTTPGTVVKHRTLLSSFTERKDLAERFASGEFHFARKDPDTVSLLLKIKTGRGLNLDPFLRDEPSLKGTEIINSKEWIVGGPFKVVDVSSTGPNSYEVTVERAKEVRKHAAPVHPGTGTGQEVHGGLAPPSGPSKGMDPSDVADKAIKLGIHKVYASSIRDMADWASTKSGKQYGDRITGRFVDVKMARGSDAKFWPLEGSIVLTRDDGQKFRLYLKGKDYKVDPIAKHYGPGPHPSGTTQDVHGGERISPFNRALKGVENTMEAIAAVDPKLPIKVIAQWEKIGGTSRRQIRDRYIRLIEAAKKNNNWADGMDWYWRQHRDLTALADQYNQWDLQTMAAAAAALSPQAEWNANLRYTVEMAKFLDHDLIEDLSDAQLELVNAKLDADGHNLTVTNGSRLSKLTPRQATIVMFEMSKNLSDDNNGWGSGAGYTPFSDAVELFRGAKPNILRGVKTRSFYNMLFDPSNVVDVTIDFQMMEAAAGRVLTKNENSSLNSTPSIQVAGEKTSIGVRPYLADITRSVAAKFGITPSQAQAIIWLQWKDTK